jgi:hypothetical protein
MRFNWRRSDSDYKIVKPADLSAGLASEKLKFKPKEIALHEMSRFAGTMPNNGQCVAGIPAAIKSAQLKYNTASFKDEELPSAYINGPNE